MDSYNIIFSGNTKVGKSSIINKLFGKGISKIGNGYKSETKEPIKIVHNKRKSLETDGFYSDFDIFKEDVVVYDMPGIDEINIEESYDNNIEEIDYVDKYKNIYHEAYLICFVITPDNCNSASFYKIVKKIENNIANKYCKFLFILNKCEQISYDKKEMETLIKDIIKKFKINEKYEPTFTIMSTKDDSYLELINIINSIYKKLYYVREEKYIFIELNKTQTNKKKVIPAKMFIEALKNLHIAYKKRELVIENIKNVNTYAGSLVTGMITGAQVLLGPMSVLTMPASYIIGTSSIIAIDILLNTIKNSLEEKDLIKKQHSFSYEYEQYKSYGFDKYEFSSYFPEDFNKEYTDFVYFQLDKETYLVKGIFKQFELIEILEYEKTNI